MGSLLHSGSRQTLFSSQLMRYADLYASSCLNLLYYPFSYLFRAPPVLMPHESTVDHYQLDMSVLDLALANRLSTKFSILDQSFRTLSTSQSLSLTRALYFHIGETEKKCFIEEIPDETMVIGKYRTQLWDKQTAAFLPSTPGLGMHVEVKDPDTKVVLSRQYGAEGRFTFTSHTPGEHQICLHSNSSKMALFTGGKLVVLSRQYGAEGRFTFTSHTPGEHQICLHSNSSKMALFTGGKLRVHLDIQVGEHTNNYPEIAAKDKLTELQLRVRQLLDQVEQIQKEQNYQRYREEHFRMTSESTNQRVLWWSITQTVILLITGIWQMRHLKSFFEAKKLV
ncbi:UNVERIFIED_CONTAM: hypothetical protein FKN15_070482 [Acipenser sinensis]